MVGYRDTKMGRTHSLTTNYVVICLPISIGAGLGCTLPWVDGGGARDESQQQRRDGAGDLKRRSWEEDGQIFVGQPLTALGSII